MPVKPLALRLKEQRAARLTTEVEATSPSSGVHQEEVPAIYSDNGEAPRTKKRRASEEESSDDDDEEPKRPPKRRVTKKAAYVVESEEDSTSERGEEED